MSIASPVVIDANLAVKLVLPDPLRESCRSLVGRLIDEGRELLAPTLWAYETTSTLCKIVHAGVLAPEQGWMALEALRSLGIRMVEPEGEQDRRAFAWTLRLRRRAAYDSYYLALAEQYGCDFWTADRRLFNATGLPWVRFVGGD